MLININGNTIIETELIIGFSKTKPDFFPSTKQNQEDCCIYIYMKDFEENSPITILSIPFSDSSSRYVAFQKLEKLLNVTNL